MGRFESDVYSSYILSSFYNQNFSSSSPLKMLFDGGLAVNLGQYKYRDWET